MNNLLTAAQTLLADAASVTDKSSTAFVSKSALQKLAAEVRHVATPDEITEARRITDGNFILFDDNALVSRHDETQVVWVQAWVRITE